MPERTFCPEGERNLTAYLEGRLDRREKEAFEGHLAACSLCHGEIEVWEGLRQLPVASPGPYFRSSFDHMLARESARLGNGARPLPFWRRTAVLAAAAAALVIGGFFAGTFWAGQRPKSEITELREELKGMRRLVAMSLLQQQSAVERLRGVSYTTRMEDDDEQVVSALVATLRGDSSVDVRMAAADALRKYSGRARVRQAMADSLLEQESPMMQMTLIDSLVELQERRAANVFERLNREPDLDPGVKKRLERALKELKVQ